MSERMQRTSDNTREKMLNRYGDELVHKHNTNRRPYRMHSRTHPCLTPNHTKMLDVENVSSGLLREFKLRKIRTRLGKGNFH